MGTAVKEQCSTKEHEGGGDAVRWMSVSKMCGGALPAWTRTVVLNPSVFPCSSLVKVVGLWFGFSCFCCAVVK